MNTSIIHKLSFLNHFEYIDVLPVGSELKMNLEVFDGELELTLPSLEA
jgi:hypothetical protein